MMEESALNSHSEANIGDDLLSSIEESLSRAHSAQANADYFPDMISTLPNSSDATEEKLVWI